MQYCNETILSRKKETEDAVMSGVANPSPAPALTVLNIFNAVKLEKLMHYIYTHTHIHTYTHTNLLLFYFNFSCLLA